MSRQQQSSHYIRDSHALDELVSRLTGVERLAIDTEFVREHQYYPRLEIIQIATAEVEAILDFRALGSLGSFETLLHDRRTLKILHSGKQDLEIFYNKSGAVPGPLFDTQVAAALLGFGAQVGYSNLVHSLLGVSLGKGETLTDWSRRPLSEAQQRYALNDVRYLLEIHARLSAQLEERGRATWLDDEWAAMEDPARYRRPPPEEAYVRVQGSNRLGRREQAILRELAAWREREAEKRDIHPNRVLRDNLLVELARRAPERRRELGEIRGFPQREIDRRGDAILEAIRAGRSVPASSLPRPPVRNRLTSEENALVTLLQAWLRMRAGEVNVAPSYLATSADLRALVSADPREREGLELLSGWRRRLVGEDLLALLEGRAQLGWEPSSGRLRLDRDGGA